MCSCQKSTFALVKDTWTPKSDLSMGGYDPFPELLPKPAEQQASADLAEQKIGVENYENCGGYSLGTWPKVQNAIPMSQNSYSMNLRPIKEGYHQGHSRRAYADSKDTWGVKSRYQL